jgi:hypothetical protein
LDAAKEKVEVARWLANKIEIFEVTITMIPRRGSTEHFKGERYERKKTTMRASHWVRPNMCRTTLTKLQLLLSKQPKVW